MAPDLFGLALGAELTTQFDGGQPLAQRVEFPGGLLGIASLDQSGCGEPGYLVAQPAAGRMARALKPGGWLLLAHGRFTGDPIQDALNRFKTASYGGTALTDDDARALLSGAGFSPIRSLSTPPGAPPSPQGRI